MAGIKHSRPSLCSETLDDLPNKRSRNPEHYEGGSARQAEPEDPGQDIVWLSDSEGEATEININKTRDEEFYCSRGSPIDKTVVPVVELPDVVVEYIATSGLQMWAMEIDGEEYLRDGKHTSIQEPRQPSEPSERCIAECTAALRLQAANWEKWLRWSGRVGEHRLNLGRIWGTGRHILQQITYIQKDMVDELGPSDDVPATIQQLMDAAGEVKRLVLLSHFTILQMDSLFGLSRVWKPQFDRAVASYASQPSPAALLEPAEVLLDWRDASRLCPHFQQLNWRLLGAFNTDPDLPERLPKQMFNFGNPLNVTLPRSMKAIVRDLHASVSQQPQQPQKWDFSQYPDEDAIPDCEVSALIKLEEEEPELYALLFH
ncbi:hypothetical protein FRC10_009303 [Ceratobasidium sp. 414]|nr:hypothetical protein FRC10_009303 [Ceratobasidium sp. 414]